MNNAQNRLVYAVFALMSLGGLLWNWHMALTEGQYYIKLAIFAPIGIVMFLAMAIKPELAAELEDKAEETPAPAPAVPGMAEDTKQDRKRQMTMLTVLGFAAGLANWYLISH